MEEATARGPVRWREIGSLAADGSLITAGAFAALIGAAFGLEALGVAPAGDQILSGSGGVLALISWLLQVGGFVIGPLLAWRLHQRRFAAPEIVGLLAGFPIAGALVMPVAMLGALLDWFVGLFTDTLYVGAIAYLVVLVLAFLGVIVWLTLDAIRDLRSSPRTHAALDVWRIVALVAVAAFAIAVIVVAARGGDAEAVAFLLLGAAEGAAVVAVADVISRLIRFRQAPSAGEVQG